MPSARPRPPRPTSRRARLKGDKAKDLIAFAGAITVATHGRYAPQIGAVPIELVGETVGGIGASGAQGHEDEAVVRTALEKVVGGGG